MSADHPEQPGGERALMVLRYLRGAHPSVDLDLVRSAMDAEYRRGLATPPAPAQEAGSGRQAAVEVVARWRVGRNYGIHVYQGDLAVATFFRPEDAEAAVRAYNAALSQPGEPT